MSTAATVHSDFREDPGGRAVRSSDSILKWIYGGPAAMEEGRRLLELHARLPEQVRYLPLAYHARRHANELAKLDHRMRVDAPPARPVVAAA